MSKSQTSSGISLRGIATTDLSDQFEAELTYCQTLLPSFGGRSAFQGPISTVSVLEDNVLVRKRLETPGDGHILVVDGGGSMNCALLGDIVAGLAVENEWAGVIINGCVRDAATLRSMPLGVRALGTHPRRSKKEGKGEVDVPVTFGGVTFRPGQYAYVDIDGIVIAPRKLDMPPATGG